MGDLYHFKNINPSAPICPRAAASALQEHKIIDRHILNWFNAFYSIANEAAHEVDSSKVFEMEYAIKKDLFDTTIKLGQHLIIQLFSKADMVDKKVSQYFERN